MSQLFQQGMHGEEDPILPVQNGKALASGIANSRALTLPGVGHELPQESLRVIVEEMAKLVKQNERRY